MEVDRPEASPSQITEAPQIYACLDPVQGPRIIGRGGHRTSSWPGTPQSSLRGPQAGLGQDQASAGRKSPEQVNSDIQVQNDHGKNGETNSLPGLFLSLDRPERCLLAHPHSQALPAIPGVLGWKVYLPVQRPSVRPQYRAEGVLQDDAPSALPSGRPRREHTYVVGRLAGDGSLRAPVHGDGQTHTGDRGGDGALP